MTAELERRVRERSKVFRPIKPDDPNPFDIPSNDQYGFIYSEADERWIIGGVRSGKTEIEVHDADIFAQGRHPVRSVPRPPPVKLRMAAPSWRENVKGVLVRKFYETADRSVLRGGSWKTGYSEGDHTLYYKNGSWIQFKSYNEDPDTFDGIDLDGIYLDEPAPFWLYHKCAARVAERNGFIVGGMSPEKGITWQRDHIEHPPEEVGLQSWVFTTLGNPYLNAAGVKKLKARLQRDPALLNAKVYGMFVSLEGLCVPQFNRELHVIPDRQIKPNAYRVFCIDTHTSAPCAMLWGAWEDDGTLIIYRAEKNIRTIPEWQQYIRTESMNDGKVHLWLGDEPNTKKVNSLGDSSILEQFRQGENALPLTQVPKGPGSVDAGIMALRSMFAVDPITKKAEIYIFASCEHELRFFEGMPQGGPVWELSQWSYRKRTTVDEEKLRENPRDKGIHYCPCLRYIVAAGPGATVQDDAEGSQIVAPDGYGFTHSRYSPGRLG